MRERNADITLGVLVDPVEFKEIALNLQAGFDAPALVDDVLDAKSFGRTLRLKLGMDLLGKVREGGSVFLAYPLLPAKETVFGRITGRSPHAVGTWSRAFQAVGLIRSNLSFCAHGLTTS
jgi:hypothetical protein